MAKDKKEKIQNIIDIEGVGETTAAKLAEGGISDLMGLAVCSPSKLSELTGITEVVARKIINIARDSLEMGFHNGNEVEITRNKISKISTGSIDFDKMLGGGVESGSILEIFGEFASGKTQIGHILCVNIQKEDPDAIAVYIDTENTFRPSRLRDFARAAKLDEEKALKNVMIARAYNSDHQVLLAEKVEDLIKKGAKVKLLVVDSVTALFRAEYIGRGTLADRQQKLNKHLHTLLKLADTYNFAVYVTNQVMAKPDTFFGDPTQPIGGHILGHSSTNRIYLRKGKKGSRVAKLIDSPSLPDAEVNFFIVEGGLEDIKEKKKED